MTMVKQFRRFLMILALLTSLAGKGDDILWWLIDDDPDVIIENMGTFKTDQIWLDKNGERLEITDARVHVTGNGVDEYLMITAGAGSEVGPSIYFESLPVQMAPNYVYTDVTGLKDAAYAFAIELGNWNDFDNESGWTVMATHYIRSEDVAKHVIEDWVRYPENGWYNVTQFYAVTGVAPEPTSGIMILLGVCVLLLKRKRSS